MWIEWASAGAAMGVFATVSKFIIDARKMGIQENVDARAGVKDIVEMLRDELRLAREDTRLIREEYAQCNSRLNLMQQELFDLRSQIHALQTGAGREMAV